ncbi:MAG: MBL fold metallo-hydrolase [Clostridiales bacterium]|nr:MBL fold metallo-hydrolase [Clostridiales bacterium]
MRSHFRLPLLLGWLKVKFCTFASGSSGNCALLWLGGTYILVDAGISMRRTFSALADLGITPDMLSAILITHDHSDHVGGLPMITKYCEVPVFSSGGTARALTASGKCRPGRIREVGSGEPFTVRGLQITSFQTPHDCAESTGYTVTDGTKRLSVVTDLGVVTPGVRQAVLGSDAAIIEANHDVNMLKTGPYPYMLKVRILGPNGHLSNEAGGELAAELMTAGAVNIVLAHLSKENNTPETALAAVKGKLRAAGTGRGDLRLSVAPPDRRSEVFEI